MRKPLYFLTLIFWYLENNIDGTELIIFLMSFIKKV